MAESKGWYEKTWKPVDVGFRLGKGRGTGMASNHSNSAWFDKLVQMADKRPEKLEIYDRMDTSMDISRALDIIAEDIASDNADDDNALIIDFPDDYEPKASTLKIHNRTLRHWTKATKLDHRFFDWSREAIKYGMVMFERKPKNGSWKKIDARKIVGYKLKDENDVDSITHYMLDLGKKQNNGDPEIEAIPIDKLVILKVGEGPFGKSVLDEVHRIWKQYQLLEDALVIYRIVRAPERRVFYIDIGDQPSKKAKAYMNQIKRDMKQRQIAKGGSGDVDTTYNPANIQEDFYIAQNGEGRGSRIETLPGGANLGQMEELEFFNKRLATGLRIPPSYLDTFSEGRDGGTHNDGRLGTAYIVELRYAGYVKRLQKMFAKELEVDYARYAIQREVVIDTNMFLRIALPQSFAIYKEAELNAALLNVYSSAEAIDTLSKRFALMKYLGLTHDELEENEMKKIQEMGLVYDDLSDEQIVNAVYGDGSLARNDLDKDKQGDLANAGGFGGDDGGEVQPPDETNAAPAEAPAPRAEEEPAPEEV